MSALDKVLDFSLDDWADAQRASKSPQARLMKQAAAELKRLEAIEAAARAYVECEPVRKMDTYITLAAALRSRTDGGEE
jgi:hypothetical protein